MTAQDLRKAEARYQRAVRRSEEARGARNALVLAALDAGWTHAQIAEVTGLTRGRIGQIAITRQQISRTCVTCGQLTLTSADPLCELCKARASA